MAKTELERVTVEEFIGQIKDAPEWVIIQSPEIPGALELYVKDGEMIEGYLTPDFVELPELAVKLFFARLNHVMQDPEIYKNRMDLIHGTDKTVA